ncbi:MAG: zinc ribbon domain-containing protein, partial [Candidatus Helarchaeota archaeon]
SRCGHVSKTSRQAKRFRCRKCGFQLDADLNAARNILNSTPLHSPDAIASVG